MTTLPACLPRPEATGPASAPAGPVIGGYRFTLRCPRCGGPVAHVASGTPGMDTRAVARCEPCRRLWGVVVTLTDVTTAVGRRRGAA